MTDPNQYANWLPSKLFQQNGELFLEWVYLWDVHFEKPFFDETLTQCRFENSLKEKNQKERRITPVDFISEVAATIEPIKPSLFIFHTSRCGSTLTTQILSLNTSTIVFPEYLLFDKLLQAKIDGQSVDDETRKGWVKSLVQIMGQKRFDEEEYLIIKLDSWHLSFHSIIRELFSEVPFAILYREPEVILRSNNKQWGIQFIPEIITPSTYGIVKDESESFSLNRYANQVLQKMYNYILEIAVSDPNTMLFNYDDGIEKNMQQLTSKLSFDPLFMKMEEVLERMKFHSKHPQDQFADEKPVVSEFAFDETIAIYNCVVQFHRQLNQDQ